MRIALGRLMIALWLLVGPAWPRTVAADAPVAQVNGVAIRQLDLEVESYLLRSESQRVNLPLSDDRMTALRATILETLIERELLFQVARKKGIDAAGHSVDLAFKEFKRARGSEARTLSRMGIGDAELKARLRRGLIVQRLLYLDVLRHITVSETEIEAQMTQPPENSGERTQARVRHILISSSGSADAQAMARIQAVQRKLEGGIPFALAAFDDSDCSSRNRGGDLGYLTDEQMPPAFAAAVLELQPGQTSGIVTTRLGHHLIQLVDRRSAVFDGPIRPQAQRTVLFRKERSAIEAYTKRLKAQAEIRY